MDSAVGRKGGRADLGGRCQGQGPRAGGESGGREGGRTEGHRQVEWEKAGGATPERWFSVGAALLRLVSSPAGRVQLQEAFRPRFCAPGLFPRVRPSVLPQRGALPRGLPLRGVERPQGNKGTSGDCTAGLGWGQRTGLPDTPSLGSCRRSPVLQRPRPGPPGPPSSTCRHRCSQPGPQRPDLTPHPGPCPTQLRDLPQLSRGSEGRAQGRPSRRAGSSRLLTASPCASLCSLGLHCPRCPLSSRHRCFRPTVGWPGRRSAYFSRLSERIASRSETCRLNAGLFSGSRGGLMGPPSRSEPWSGLLVWAPCQPAEPPARAKRAGQGRLTALSIRGRPTDVHMNPPKAASSRIATAQPHCLPKRDYFIFGFLLCYFTTASRKQAPYRFLKSGNDTRCPLTNVHLAQSPRAGLLASEVSTPSRGPSSLLLTATPPRTHHTPPLRSLRRGPARVAPCTSSLIVLWSHSRGLGA